MFQIYSAEKGENLKFKGNFMGLRYILPRKLNKRKRVIILACQDFYNELSQSAKKIALYLMRRKRKKIELTEEEKEDMEIIRQNLKDKTYLEELEKQFEISLKVAPTRGLSG